MYFLYHGEVEVLVGPEENRVATLRDGSVFGEMALLGFGKRSATVRAVKVCDCRVIKASVFCACLKRFPGEKTYFSKLARERLRRSTISNRASASIRAPPSPSSHYLKKNGTAVLPLVKLESLKSTASSASTAFERHTSKNGTASSSATTTSTTDDLGAEYGKSPSSSSSSRTSLHEDMAPSPPQGPRHLPKQELFAFVFDNIFAAPDAVSEPILPPTSPASARSTRTTRRATEVEVTREKVLEGRRSCERARRSLDVAIDRQSESQHAQRRSSCISPAFGSLQKRQLAVQRQSEVPGRPQSPLPAKLRPLPACKQNPNTN